MEEFLGTITKIEMQKNNKNRCSIFLDEEFLVGVDAELVYKFNLEKGRRLSQDILEYILDQEDFIKAKKAAFNLLSYRQRSYGELEFRLINKGFDDFIVDQVIRVMERLGYLDDREFANAWIKDRVRKNYGPFVIKMQLRKKKVDDQIIDKELDQEYPYELQYQQALKLTQKRVRRYSKYNNRKQRYKLSQVLQRKGFSFDVINLVLDDVLNN